MKLNRILFGASIMIASLSFISCKKEDNKKEELNNKSIEHESEFGGIYIHETIDEFNELGFKYGDSINISFSNGKSLDDIPYYNGYYTKNGEILLVAYPGYPYIKVCINNGDDLWEEIDLLNETITLEKSSLWANLGVDENTTASIKLNEKGKYIDIQEARDIHYSDNINDYTSLGYCNYVFANFRSLKGGKLKPNTIFRSASPCDNQHNRAKYVNDLIEECGINYILDLADTDEKIQGYMSKPDFKSNYFKSLYENDKVIPLALNMNFESDYFKSKVILAMKTLEQKQGPFLVHCTEGKDRTGFLCLLIEALAGASYREIVEDYMTTYFNYYSLLGKFDASKYDTIVSNVLNPMLETIVNDGSNLEDANYASYANNYLISNGLTQDEINNILNNICQS